MAAVEVPKHQKAWMVQRQGVPADVLELQNDVPVGSLCKGEVLVKIHAAGMNPLGWKAMQAFPTVPLVMPRPHVAEYDFSGIIVASQGTPFTIGDEVYGFVPPFNRKAQGSFAEYAVVPADYVVIKPANVSWTDAAGLGLAGVTAWGAIVDVCKIKEGDHVFINGGSTSVGLIAMQVAKAKGCKVTVATSARNFEYVRSFGADEAIDYHENPPADYFASHPPSPLFDVLFDAVATSPDLFNNSEAYLNLSGVYVSVGAPISSISDIVAFAKDLSKAMMIPGWAGGVKRRFARYSLGSTGFSKVLVELNKLLVEGQVNPVVDSIHKFEDALKAYERIMSERTRGKVILEVSDVSAIH